MSCCCECHSAKCHSAECYSAQCHCTICHSTECRSAECHCVECNSAQLNYAKGHSDECNIAFSHFGEGHSAEFIHAVPLCWMSWCPRCNILWKNKFLRRVLVTLFASKSFKNFKWFLKTKWVVANFWKTTHLKQRQMSVLVFGLKQLHWLQP